MEEDVIAWRPQNNPEGAMKSLSDILCRIGAKEKCSLPYLHGGNTLLVISDYSGQHDTAKFQSLSFLIADIEKCDVWQQKRKLWRQQCVPDGRRIAFKSLKDKIKSRSLDRFLDAADCIHGLSITVLIHKDIKSLFAGGNRIDWQNPELTPYKHWPKNTFEKMLRIVHFVSFFVSGLSKPRQNILWITDEDEIAANEARLCELTDILANVCSHYLNHDLGHLRCGTTKSDSGSRDLEDLASIPDLISGMLAEAVTEQRNQNLLASGGLITPPPKDLRDKIVRLMNWFSTNRKTLKRLVFLIEPAPTSPHLEIKRLKFHGSNDLPD